MISYLLRVWPAKLKAVDFGSLQDEGFWYSLKLFVGFNDSVVYIGSSDLYSEFQLTWNIQLGKKKSKIVLR